MMKAAQLINEDGKQELEIKDVERPVVAEGKLLVEVHEAGVNPLDWKIAEGWYQAPTPVTMGGDFAGVIAEVGPGVSGLKPGDEVYGQAGFYNGGTGSFAQYDLAEAASVAPKPKTLSEAEASALPMAGMMALQALTEQLRLGQGQMLLIQGGAGGIGTIAIQLAKHLGAQVAVTCAADEIDYVKSLGADEAIDFRARKFEEVVHDYDAVYDLVGGDVYRRSYQVLKPGGAIISSLERPDSELMEKYGVTAIYQSFDVTTARLNKLAELVDAGVIKIHVEKTFPLQEARDALSYQENVHPKGKIVIDVK